MKTLQFNDENLTIINLEEVTGAALFEDHYFDLSLRENIPIYCIQISCKNGKEYVVKCYDRNYQLQAHNQLLKALENL